MECGKAVRSTYAAASHEADRTRADLAQGGAAVPEKRQASLTTRRATKRPGGRGPGLGRPRPPRTPGPDPEPGPAPDPRLGPRPRFQTTLDLEPPLP